MATLKISPKALRALASKTQPKRIAESLGALAPEKKTLAAIRATARKNGKSKLSLLEIDREIRAYRRERPL